MRHLLLVAALPLAACGHASANKPGVPGTGSGPARSFAVADFTGVEVAGPDPVEISTGTGFSVRAEGDPSVLDKLRITREGGSLKVDRERGVGISLRATKVFVTMPRIADAAVSGSGDLLIDHVDGDRFNGATTGSGGLSVRALRVGAASVSTGGSGDVTLEGEAKSLTAAVTGSGSIDARHVKVSDATVEVSGSGGVRAEVTGSATVALSGSGDVDLGSAARCQISKAGSGSVRCGR